MFTTSAPVLPDGFRFQGDKILKHVNLLLGMGLLACLLITATDVDRRASNTLDNFWGQGRLRLRKEIEATIANCSVDSSMTLGDYEIRYRLDEATVPHLMAHAAALIKRGLLVSCGAVFISLVNKVAFNYNLHELKYRSFVASKGYLVLLEVLAIVWAIVALKHPQGLSKELTDYLKHCSEDAATDVQHLFEAPPFIAMFVAHGVTLLAYVITAVMLLDNSARPLPQGLKHAWVDVSLLLSKCPKHSPVPALVALCLQRELNGFDGQPGIKHLLAKEYTLLDTDILQKPPPPPPPPPRQEHSTHGASNYSSPAYPHNGAYEMDHR